MKKIIFFIWLIVICLSFGNDIKKEIYNLISEIELAPENYKNTEKWQKVLRFAIEDEETEIHLINTILGNKENDKVDDESQSTIIMAYTMGALKDQLVSENKLTKDESIIKGTFAALKTYNRLKKTQDIYIGYFEFLNQFDFSKLLD